MTSQPESMSPQEIDCFFESLSSINPHPKTELEYTNPFTLVIAVILSAQATDTGVNKATSTLFKIAKTPEEMLNLGEEGLKQYIKSINYYNNKAKNIIRLSEILVKEFNGQIPQTREELEKLPGIGRKTANVILNVAFNQPTIAIDTHIFRVANRTGMATGKTPLAVEQQLLKRIPKRWLTHAHHWLVLHGRYICKARKPECQLCPVNSFCHYPFKTKA